MPSSLAIVGADVAGYSRLIRGDEGSTVEALKGPRRAPVAPKIAGHRAGIVELIGDASTGERREAQQEALQTFPQEVAALHRALHERE